jgi:hypothetical protein
MEPDLQERLQEIQERLRRIKALLAWEQLKRREAQSQGISMFQLRDSTAEDLRNEYSLLLTGLLQMYSLLSHRSSITAQSIREDVFDRLAEIEWQLYRLQLGQRFGGPRR